MAPLSSRRSQLAKTQVLYRPQIHAVDAKFCILKLRSDSQAGRCGFAAPALDVRAADTIEIAIRDFCKHRSCTGLALWANARGRGFAQSLHHVREKQHLVDLRPALRSKNHSTHKIETKPVRW